MGAEMCSTRSPRIEGGEAETEMYSTCNALHLYLHAAHTRVTRGQSARLVTGRGNVRIIEEHVVRANRPQGNEQVLLHPQT